MLWACGDGIGGRLGLNDESVRLSPTRVGPQHFGGACVTTVAAGFTHSAALTEDGKLYTWGSGEVDVNAKDPDNEVDVRMLELLFKFTTATTLPGGLGHADLLDRLVPSPLSPCLFDGDRVGRCHGLTEEHALAFAMGTHARLGAGAAGGGRRRSRRVQGKAPEEEGRGCAYSEMAGELVQQVVEACRWEVGEGVARLMGLAA